MPPPPDPWDDSLSGGGGWRCVGMEPTLADSSMARPGAGTYLLAGGLPWRPQFPIVP